jgi:hypothetical protein
LRQLRLAATILRVGVLGLIVTIFLLPENRGKSLKNSPISRPLSSGRPRLGRPVTNRNTNLTTVLYDRTNSIHGGSSTLKNDPRNPLSGFLN